MAILTCGTGGTYATLAFAVAAASANDTIIIQPDTYSGTGWQNVTLAVRLDVVATGATLTNTGSSYHIRTTADACTITGGRWILNSGLSAYIFRLSSSACVVTGATMSITVSGGKYGIYLDKSGVSCFSVADCTVTGSAKGAGYGIARASGSTGSGTDIQRCTITALSGGIMLDSSVGNADTGTINRCHITNCTIGIDYPRAHTVTNCRISGCDQGIYHGNGATVDSCTIRNCTDGIRASVAAAYAAITNNILTGHTDALHGATGTEPTPANNIYFGNTNNYNAYTADSGAITTDPDLDANDMPSLSSPAIDASTTTLLEDHYGTVRPQLGGPDIGAVEALPPDPPAPPTPRTGRRHEVHRLWQGGTIGTITIRGSDYDITLQGGNYTVHDLAADLEDAVEAATGIGATAYLSPARELCLAFGEAWTWAGVGGWNGFAGWTDGAVSGAPGDYTLTGTAESCAAEVCAVRLSWARYHTYRQIQTAPASAVPVAVAVLSSPLVDFDAEVFVPYSHAARLWISQPWCYYRGTDTEWSAPSDVDGWLVMSPIETPREATTPLDGYAGTVAIAGTYTRVEGD